MSSRLQFAVTAAIYAVWVLALGILAIRSSEKPRESSAPGVTAPPAARGSAK